MAISILISPRSYCAAFKFSIIVTPAITPLYIKVMFASSFLDYNLNKGGLHEQTGQLTVLSKETE